MSEFDAPVIQAVTNDGKITLFFYSCEHHARHAASHGLTGSLGMLMRTQMAEASISYSLDSSKFMLLKSRNFGKGALDATAKYYFGFDLDIDGRFRQTVDNLEFLLRHSG